MNKQTGIAAIKKRMTLYRVSRHLGLTRQAVYQWQDVPLQYVPKLSELTGLSYHELRPDVFPDDTRAEA